MPCPMLGYATQVYKRCVNWFPGFYMACSTFQVMALTDEENS